MLNKTIALSTIAAALLIAGCSGGSGQGTEQLPDTSGNNNNGSVYSGPAPRDQDVQDYKRFIWDNLATEDRCGSCHIDGGQSPQFVRSDDINAAYDAGRPLISLSSPAESRLATKVGGGHNCWLADASACAEIITNYIEEWALENGSLANTLVLTAPALREVGESRSFPESSGNFANTVYPLLTEYCAGCHSEDAPTAQQPYFGSSDVDIAYEASKSRMNLDTPANSRFSVRLGREFHNCWSDCADNEDEMTAAIQAFANNIPLTTVDSSWVISKAMRLPDGIVASSGGRIENNAIALYEFKTGTGTTAYDTSGVNPAIDLNLSGDVEWLGSWGIQLKGGKAQGATASSRKLFDTLTASGEYSIEAWVAPANVVQEGPARIITYSGSNDSRNFTLGQVMYNYTFQNRNNSSDANGMPVMITDDMAERAQATLQHVVATYSAVEGRKLYVNGEYTGDPDPGTADLLSTWDESFALAIGSEVSNEFGWEGSVRLLAIHSRALAPEDIATNYNAGVGEKYLLLFNVDEHTGLTDSYVMFQVQLFDNYGYLFSEPKFISLDETADLSGLVIEGLRIGINGREAEVGQAWSRLAATVDDTYIVGEGQPLSRLGSIISVDKGPEADDFFLTFERIGDATYTRVEPTPAAPPEPANLEPQPRIGLRRFEQINAALSRATGVASSNPDVAETWDKVKRQLPVESDIQGFLSAHQMGITQLAVKYCSVLVDSPAASGYFAGFDFTDAVTSAFDTDAKKAQVVDPLIENLLAHDITWHDGSVSPLATAAQSSEVRTELNALIDKMVASCGTNCGSTRTVTTVKATCAAAMGSAMILIH